MRFRTYTPRPPLSDFVEMFWLLEGLTHSHKERALPTGTVELIISLRDGKLRVFDPQQINVALSFRDAMVCGPHSEFFVIDSAKDESVIGVHFKPGGAFPFLKLPAGELHNTHVALETLWGSQAAILREQLLEAQTPLVRFHTLEQFMLAFAKRPLVHHPAVAFALQQFQTDSHTRVLAHTIARIGLSQKHFIRIFRDEVGLTPKRFCRIQRFQKVLRHLEKEQQIEWVDVALSCGYYDQAHFINDFQTFSGLNPTSYLVQRGDRNPNHVPIRV